MVNLIIMWFGPFKIVEVVDNNTFVLQHLDNEELSRCHVNGRFLKHLFT